MKMSQIPKALRLEGSRMTRGWSGRGPSFRLAVCDELEGEAVR